MGGGEGRREEGEESCPAGFCVTPSPLGGALGTSRDWIFCVAGREGGVDGLPHSPHLSPLPQASLRANIPAGPSISLCPPSLCTGRLSETKEEARLPGRVGLPGMAQPHSVTPPVPETLQALDLSGHPATQRQGLSGGTECVWDSSEVRFAGDFQHEKGRAVFYPILESEGFVMYARCEQK